LLLIYKNVYISETVELNLYLLRFFYSVWCVLFTI